MTRVRTFFAAALLTIPMLTVSATTPVVDQSAQVMRDSSLPAPQTGFCVFMAGYWWCY